MKIQLQPCNCRHRGVRRGVRSAAAYRRGDATTEREGNGAPSTRRRVSFRQPPVKRSSWDAKEAGRDNAGKEDYLYEIGNSSSVNLNIDTAQNSTHLDSLFTGEFLGQQSDIADGTLRKEWEFRTYNNIVGDYYIAPRFLQAVSMHIVKNYLQGQGVLGSRMKVPLILGIWGAKGCGKTFQTELVFRKMGVEPIIMSAGELEHEWAGTPGRLIRERYRRAAELSKVRGKLSCLVINDLDAGIGRYQDTQCTVNNQIVVGTLMNICDNPTQVSDGLGWRDDEVLTRIPIIATGNDFSTLYAPLLRDGRMHKFYWEPSRQDLLGILFQMFKDDNLSERDMEILVDTYPNQPLDFFGAIRSTVYDEQIRDWITNQVVDGQLNSEDADLSLISKKLLRGEGPDFVPVELTVDMLLEKGNRLVMEQEMVNRFRLSEEYMKTMERTGNGGGIGLRG